MDLLTLSGWFPTYNLESVFLPIFLALSSPDPRPARLAPVHYQKGYSKAESWEAFKRVATTHGWNYNVSDGKFFVQ